MSAKSFNDYCATLVADSEFLYQTLEAFDSDLWDEVREQTDGSDAATLQEAHGRGREAFAEAFAALENWERKDFVRAVATVEEDHFGLKSDSDSTYESDEEEESDE